MISHLDRKWQRYLAVGILVAAISLVFACTVVPIWYLNASRQEVLDNEYARLRYFTGISERDGQWLPRYQEAWRLQKSAGNHLSADTLAVAGAELQARLKDIAEEHGARVLSTQILPASPQEGFIRVALKVRAGGSLDSILGVIHGLEADQVYMFVDNLSLRRGSSVFKMDQQAKRNMESDFDLIAYMPDES